MPSNTAVEGVARFAELTKPGRPATVVIAGVGYGHEVPLMRELWPQARLIGVEPVSENRKRMDRSEAWVGSPSDLLPVALAAEAGSVTLQLNYEADQRASMYEPVAGDLPGAITREVEAWTLADLWERVGGWKAPALLWLDAQGAESEILAGAQEEQLATFDWINVELNQQPARSCPPAWQVDRHLRSLGFFCAWQHSLGKQGHTIDGVYVPHRTWMQMRAEYALAAGERKKLRLKRKRRRQAARSERRTRRRHEDNRSDTGETE